MKKSVKIMAVIIVLVCLLTVNVSAYEFNGDSMFTVNIPEEFTENQGSNNYMFESEDGRVFSVSIEENTENTCIKDLTKKEIKEMNDEIASTTEEQMKDYGVKAKVEYLDSKKTKYEDGTVALVSVIKTTLPDNDMVFYQKNYTFGGIDNMYTFVYTAKTEDDINDLNSAFESIVINEAQVRGKYDNLAVYLIAVGMAGLLVAGIIRFLRTPEKRAQGKL